MAAIHTANVYEPARPEDGLRVLVMRLWPRGVPRGDIRLWLKDLGAPLKLIKDYKNGKINWIDFKRAYQKHLKTEAAQHSMKELRQRLEDGPVTLLCGCHEATRCHRSLVAAALKR